MVNIYVILADKSQMQRIVSYINANINLAAGTACAAALCVLPTLPSVAINFQWDTFLDANLKSWVSIEESLYLQHQAFFDALEAFEIMTDPDFQTNYPNSTLLISF